MFLLLTVFGWGLNWPINKLILDSMSAYWLVALRSAIAAPLVGVLAATFALRETPGAAVWIAMACITVGVLIGTRSAGKRAA